MRKYPVGMVLGGYFATTGPIDQGAYGWYWSSSAFTDATLAYRLLLNGTNSTVYPALSSYKRSGFPLRCLAQNQIKNRLGSNKKTKQNNTN